MKGINKSKSAQRLMDVARKNLSWYSYSSILSMIGQVVRGKVVRGKVVIRRKDVLEAIGMLAQSTEEQ